MQFLHQYRSHKGIVQHRVCFGDTTGPWVADIYAAPVRIDGVTYLGFSRKYVDWFPDPQYVYECRPCGAVDDFEDFKPEEVKR